jgi:predicted transcriptional regulator
MHARKKLSLEKPLTEVELELMNIIWDLGDETSLFTVKEVQSQLSATRELAYTSVATIIKILEQKGVLSSHKSEKAHQYRALITRAEYEATSLRHLADHLFKGDPSTMVMRLLDEGGLSTHELNEIRKTLESKLLKK